MGGITLPCPSQAIDVSNINAWYHKISFFYASDNEVNSRFTVESYLNQNARTLGFQPLQSETIEIVNALDTTKFKNVFYLDTKEIELKTDKSKVPFSIVDFTNSIYASIGARGQSLPKRILSQLMA